MSRKIIDIIKNNKHITYSFEVTPDISAEEVLKNLDLEPLFFSITWHAQKIYKTDTFDLNDTAPIKLSKYLRSKNKNVLLHISCTNLKKYCIEKLLTCLKDNDICNIFIILGENYDSNESDFKSSRELILFIRRQTGNFFCIGVAGFPDKEDKVIHLKEKIESGADFILTQAFFDSKVYKNFLNTCKEIKINVPVIPGIFPFETKGELDFFMKLCDVHLPSDSIVIADNTGIKMIAQLIVKIKNECHYNHFHLFTLNNFERSFKLIKIVESLEK